MGGGGGTDPRLGLNDNFQQADSVSEGAMLQVEDWWAPQSRASRAMTEETLGLSVHVCEVGDSQIHPPYPSTNKTSPGDGKTPVSRILQNHLNTEEEDISCAPACVSVSLLAPRTRPLPEAERMRTGCKGPSGIGKFSAIILHTKKRGNWSRFCAHRTGCSL